ncbi:hypothetical protein SLEP1_g54596 [Rubroshorea leprosula]|uniref:Uncharacterized protein n=1 Tax=Rubroshorea leprosula TaxID=152421 RepID=A0AAV5ME19_9ROSI|nr:hypothetical protein SLEP1_g54596 [Rubroshorea leprosula]
MITSASAITLCVLINQGFEEHTIEKLWVCASVCICAYCLIELIRTAKPSGMILFMFLLSSAIDKTEGHQYWRIVFSVLLVATLLSVSFGQANLRREAVTAPNQKSFFSPYLHSGLTCKAPRWILEIDTPMLKSAIIGATFRAEKQGA